MNELPTTMDFALPHWPYLATAAVLTDFVADKLLPLGGGKPDLSEVGAMLMEHGEAITIGPAKGRWSLSNNIRRAVLVELKRQGRLVEALQSNQAPDKPGNPTQQALDSLILGKQQKITGKSLVDLLGLERAIDLLGPAIDIQQTFYAQVLARIEYLRLIEPLQRLIADGFAGRTEELKILRSYVDELPPQSFHERISRNIDNVLEVFRHRPPLIIWGPGGVGKSTLLAKFLLDHAGPEQTKPTPFIYLDFDRGQLDPLQPDTILEEAFRQIQVQFPEFTKTAADLETATKIRISSEDKQNISKSAHFERSMQLRKDFVELLQGISTQYKRNLLLFIDTFEVVQRRGLTQVYNVLKLAAELLKDMHTLRIVIAGRATLRDADFQFADKIPRWKSMPLEGFDNQAGRAYLQVRIKRLGVINVSSQTLDRIVAIVKGNPLSLRLAAQVFAREGLTAIEDTLGRARFDAAFAQERLQGILHHRIVDHLPERLRNIADPGLIVRRITPDVITQVLAEPCKLDLKDPSEAEQLFEDLKNEVALVEPIGQRVLRHRPDVRLLMLPLLREKLGELSRRIDEKAVAFWKAQNNPEARAEEIYHLLWLGADNNALEDSWQRGPVAKLALEEALDELEALEGSPLARIWLSGKLEREISAALEQRAHLIDWERHIELRARSLLASGSVNEALKVMHSRKDRTPISPLWLLELEALKLLGKDEEALKLTDKAWNAAKGTHAPEHIHALLLQKVSLLERMDRLEQAIESITQANELAKMMKSDILEFATGVTRARLFRKTGRNGDFEILQQHLVAMVDKPAVAKALSEHPTLLGEATAELGILRPDLFIHAVQRLGIEGNNGQAKVSTLVSLGVAYANRGELEKAIELLEQSLTTAQKINDQTGQAMAMLHLGNTYRVLGQLSGAMKLYDESLILAHELNSPKIELNALSNLGTAYADIGDLHQAVGYYEKSLAIARSINDLGGEGNALNNLANVNWRLGDQQRAIEQLQMDLDIARRRGDRRGERQTLSNLGVAYSNQGDHRRAIELYMQSLSIAQELGDIRGECMVLSNLGGIYIELEELERAKDFSEKALVISKKVGDRAAEASILGNLGIIHRKVGDFSQAHIYYQQQLYIVSEIGDRLGEGTARYNLALTLDAESDRGSAINEMQRAVDVLQVVNSPLAEQANEWLTNYHTGSREVVNNSQEVKQGDFDALKELSASNQAAVDILIKQSIKIKQ